VAAVATASRLVASSDACQQLTDAVEKVGGKHLLRNY